MLIPKISMFPRITTKRTGDIVGGKNLNSTGNKILGKDPSDESGRSYPFRASNILIK